MKSLGIFLYYLNEYKYFIIPFLILLLVILTKRNKNKKTLIYRSMFVGLFSFFLIFFSRNVVNLIISKAGIKENAVITAIEPTNSYVNKQRVMRYILAIKTNDKIYDVSFKSWNNVFFPGNNMEGSLVTVGQKFTVQLLENYPNIFIILTNENDEYNKSTACNIAAKTYNEARLKFELDTTNAALRQNFANEMENYFIDKNCLELDSSVLSIQQEKIRWLRSY